MLNKKKIKDIKDFNNGKITGSKISAGGMKLVYFIRQHRILGTPLELLVKEEGSIRSASSKWEPTEGGWGTAEIASMVGSSDIADEILLRVGITKIQN